jgi:hypothetical protein
MTESAPIYAYPPSDERPHVEGGEPFWQESIFFFWWDDAAGIGGIHRLGHEPKLSPPMTTTWNGVFSRDGQRFRHYGFTPMQEGERQTDGLQSGPSWYRYDGKWRFGVDQPDCSIELTVEDYLPRLHMYPEADVGDIHRDYARHHYESAGLATGQVRLGQRTVEVNALSYRDHSWGRREWSTLLAHRYFAGTTGPEFTCCTIHWLSPDGSISHFGLVIRDGVAVYADSVDFLTFMEADGTTHRGGVVTFHMPGGEAIEVQLSLVDAMVNEHGGETQAAIAATDGLCLFTHNGKTGFGDLEITNNPRNGADRVKATQRAVNANGLTSRPQRPADPSALRSPHAV